MSEQLKRPLLTPESRQVVKVMGKSRYWRATGYRTGYDHYGTTYEYTFAQLGYKDTVQTLEEKLRTSNVYVLDLMSLGYTLTKLPKTEGLAVGLIGKDKAKPAIGEGIHYMDADVVSRSTWRRIDLWLKERNTKFDLIVCRSGGAILQIPEIKEIHFAMLRRMYDRLNAGGSLFTDSEVELGNYLAEWVKLANENGIPAKCQLKFGNPEGGPTLEDNDVLRVDKLASSPKSLPFIDKDKVIPPRTDLAHW